MHAQLWPRIAKLLGLQEVLGVIGNRLMTSYACARIERCKHCEHAHYEN